MTDYWFARRFPVGHPRNSMSPVNDKGWAVVRTFLYWMFGGLAAALALALIGVLVLPYVWVAAPIIFFACAMVGAWSFILAAQQHGDPNHTVDDYKAGRVGPDSGATADTNPVAPQPQVKATGATPERGSTSEYWFARYRPGLPQNASRGLIALNWKGRAAIAAFVLAMIGGAALFLIFGLRDQFVVGIPIFVVCAIAGFSFFIWASVAKTDPAKSAYDYLKERQQ